MSSLYELQVPPVFWGLQDSPASVAALRALVASMPGAGDAHGPWFIADNLITFGHARGFLTDPRFVAAVTAEQPTPADLGQGPRIDLQQHRHDHQPHQHGHRQVPCATVASPMA